MTAERTKMLIVKLHGSQIATAAAMTDERVVARDLFARGDRRQAVDGEKNIKADSRDKKALNSFPSRSVPELDARQRCKQPWSP
jgi:hypothetical protein